MAMGPKQPRDGSAPPSETCGVGGVRGIGFAAIAVGPVSRSPPRGVTTLFMLPAGLVLVARRRWLSRLLVARYGELRPAAP